MENIVISNTEWDLTPLLKDDDDPAIATEQASIVAATAAFVKKWENRNDYLEKAETLKEALDEYEQWQRDYGSSGAAGFYFHLRTEQDEHSPVLKAKYNKIREFAKKTANDMQFFTHRIAKIPAEKQKQFLNSPALEEYAHVLERLFASARYLLSEPEEKILTLKSDTSYYNWVKMVSAFLSKEERTLLQDDGKKKITSFSEISSMMNSTKKNVRDSAAEAFNDILQKHVEVAESEINSILSDKKTDDELRKVPRPDALRHLADDIDSKVVDTMLSAVTNSFTIPQRFYRLKAKLLKVKKLEYHERNVPYGKIDKKYSYKDSVALNHKVLAGIDSEFSSIFKDFVENGHIDVFPRRGKSSGAFCSCTRITLPTYILLNHAEKLQDVLTLAHEVGHGINNELMRKKQNALTFDTPLSTAEVASTFMEDFVLQELMKEADDELRLALLMAKLNDEVTTIFRQVACYRFEQALHTSFREKGYLSKDDIGSLFIQNMSAYMGPAVQQSSGSNNWWVYWSHIREFFYVYSYASGLLISKALQHKVKDNPGFIEHVKEFLSAGTSASPRMIFKNMGIDIADNKFWDDGLKEIENLLNETEALANKLGKISP